MCGQQLNQTFSYIIDAGNFGRVELLVVAASGGEVEPSAAYSADEEAVVDGELDHAVQGLLPRFQKHLQLQNVVELLVSFFMRSPRSKWMTGLGSKSAP